jgi:hypothetical protein
LPGFGVGLQIADPTLVAFYRKFFFWLMVCFMTLWAYVFLTRRRVLRHYYRLDESYDESIHDDHRPDAQAMGELLHLRPQYAECHYRATYRNMYADDFDTYINHNVLRLSVPYLVWILESFYFPVRELIWFVRWTFANETPAVLHGQLRQQTMEVSMTLVGQLLHAGNMRDDTEYGMARAKIADTARTINAVPLDWRTNLAADYITPNSVKLAYAIYRDMRRMGELHSFPKSPQ